MVREPVIAAPCVMRNHDYMSTEREGAAGGSAERVRGWFLGRLPDDWFEGQPEIVLDREEITVIGHLPPVRAGEAGAEPVAAVAGTAAEGAEDEPAEAQADAIAAGRSRRFREETR